MDGQQFVGMSFRDAYALDSQLRVVSINNISLLVEEDLNEGRPNVSVKVPFSILVDEEGFYDGPWNYHELLLNGESEIVSFDGWE